MYHGKKKTVGGSVTIFLLIITLSIQMFAGVIIDGARIKLAQAKLDAAVQSALSSSMAYYDSDLMVMYDLYGVDGSGDTAQNHYLSYLDANLAGGSDLAQTTVEIDQSNTSLQLFNPYTEGTVFKDAVAEVSKYRSPVYLTDDGIEKIFSFFKCVDSDAVAATNTASQTQSDLDDQADATNSKLAKTTNSELAESTATVEGEAGSTVKVNLDSVDDSISKVDDAQSSVTSLQQAIADDDAAQAAATESWTETATNISNYADSEGISTTTSSSSTTTTNNNNNNNDGDSSSSSALATAAKTALDVKSMALSTYKKSVEDAYAKYETALASLNALKANSQTTDAALESAQEAMETAYAELVEATESLDDLLEDVDDAPTMVIASTSSGWFSTLFTSLTDLGGLIKNVTTVLGTLENLLGSLTSYMSNGSTLTFTAASESPVSIDLSALDALYEAEEDDLDISLMWSIWNMISPLLDGLVNFANTGIDNLYAVSWYKANCTYLTSRDSLLHYFLIGELEYVTFGSDNEALNILQSVGAVFCIRIIIRFLEGIAEAGGFIPLAIVDALSSACVDMLSLLTETDSIGPIGFTGSVQLSTYVPFHVTYSDHLFIILLILSIKNDMTSAPSDGDANNQFDERMLQCVDSTLAARYESTTGISGSRMDKLYTAGYATAEGSVSFLMLPDSLVSLFAPDALTEDGRYIIRSSAVLEY